MRITIMALAALATMGLEGRSGPAQERLPEPVAAPQKETPPPSHQTTEPCAPHCPSQPGFKVLWVERDVPIQTLVPREVVTMVPTTTFEVAYREEKRVFNEIVLRPREVEKPITSCTLKPVTVTCPQTGECTTVMQPCTEVKMVKQTEFYPVEVKRELIERIPYLRTVEIQVPRKDLILEYRTEMKKVPGAVKVPSGDEVLPGRTIMTIKPPCPH